MQWTQAGYPLSPYLLAVEVLCRALKEALRVGNVKGIKVGNACTLTHLLFMDDILIFCDGSRRDAEKLKEIMDLYCLVIGMQVTLEKTTIS